MDAKNRNDTARTVGMMLMVVGVALLAYGAYEYSTRDTVTDATPNEGFFEGDNREAAIPLTLGLLSLGIGGALLFMGPRTYTDGRGNFRGSEKPRRVP